MKHVERVESEQREKKKERKEFQIRGGRGGRTGKVTVDKSFEGVEKTCVSNDSVAMTNQIRCAQLFKDDMILEKASDPDIPIIFRPSDLFSEICHVDYQSL